MLNLAGKYAKLISGNPGMSAVAGGLGAAGLATLGNVVTGQAQEEAPGRLGMEALGAGAAGALLGTQIPGLRNRATTAMRNLGAVVMENPGSQARKAKMSANEIKNSEAIRDMLRGAAAAGADPSKVRDQFKTGLRGSQALVNTAGIPIGLTMAGGLGGLVGGGIANAGDLVGIPGFQQGGPVDPESYGSSNSPGARYKAPTMQYM
jgi:hypothetical protein